MLVGFILININSLGDVIYSMVLNPIYILINSKFMFLALISFMRLRLKNPIAYSIPIVGYLKGMSNLSAPKRTLNSYHSFPCPTCHFYSLPHTSYGNSTYTVALT